MLYFSRGRVFEIEESLEEAQENEEGPPGLVQDPNRTVRVVASYPREPLLLSGWILGDPLIQGGAAALDIQLGEGRIAAFGFNVHNRGQARSTLRLLFNALWPD